MSPMPIERSIDPTCTTSASDEVDFGREWLVTNGLGGYASGTLSGIITRRFHGLLIAALPVPHGRTMMLNTVQEIVHLGGVAYSLGDRQESKHRSGNEVLRSRLVQFRLTQGL